MSLLNFKDIAKIFEEIELRLISSLKRNLKRHKAEEQRYGFEWSAWQAEKLKNMENFRRENLDIMNEYVDVIDDQTRQLMTEQFQEGQQQAQRSTQELSDEPITPIPDKHFFGVNEKKMAKLMEDVTTLEKTAETAALRMTDDIYRQTLNRVQLAMGTGSMTLNEAIDLATRDFLDKGINCIVYADGKRVNIADYVRMALRTTSTRAALQGAAKRFAELGYDTVLVSQYGGCSKTCEPWQGQVYIDDVFTVWEGEKDEFQGKSNYCGEWFWLLSYAVKNGLFHPNCRHTMTQYIHGRTQIPEPIPAEKIKEQRELEQKQRAMERKVRKLKRFAAGTCDPDTAKEYRRKLRQAQQELKVFVEEHNEVLHRDHSREKYYGGGVDKSAKSDIMESKKVETAVTDVHSVGKIDVEKYQDITNKRILTNEVIITDNRIEHIIQRRGQTFYDEYHEYFSSIIEDPDYIFNDTKADTAIVSKVFSHKGKNINLVLRLVVEGDDPNFKNSIITAIGESEKRFAQRLRNNTPVYKKLDNQE